MTPGHRDRATVEGFGQEWVAFDQSGLDAAELQRIFDSYFSIFPWGALSPGARGIDVGCGSGRWAALVAPLVGRLIALDASGQALHVARRRIDATNCDVVQGAAGELPFPDGSLDFGYSLGVLHHTPDTAATLADCVAKLRPGAPFLVYLYYAFDNRPAWFRTLWRASDAVRRGVSRMPFGLRKATTSVAAALVYWPLARLAAAGERRGRDVDAWPLAFYRERSFYVMRNDALDRFGTRLERRFTREEIVEMMAAAGLRDVIVSPDPPYWCAVGYRS